MKLDKNSRLCIQTVLMISRYHGFGTISILEILMKEIQKMMVWKRYFLHNLVGLSIYVTFHGCIVPLEEVREILHLIPQRPAGEKKYVMSI